MIPTNMSFFRKKFSSNGRIDAEIDRRITNDSKAFGALQRAVFKDHTTQLPPNGESMKSALQYCPYSCSAQSAGHPCGGTSTVSMASVTGAFARC